MRMDWKPIETAPQGYCEILAYDGILIRVCRPKQFPRPIAEGGYGEDGVTEYRVGDRWEYFRDDINAPGHTWSMCPTHWLPLPEPPYPPVKAMPQDEDAGRANAKFTERARGSHDALLAALKLAREAIPAVDVREMSDAKIERIRSANEAIRAAIAKAEG